MKLTSSFATTTLAVALGLISSAYAQRFKLPACASACVALNPTCDTTGAFCNSVCFGPCLQQGCHSGADQQRLISACAKPFESGLIAPAATTTPPVVTSAVTTTRRPAQTPSSSTAADPDTLGSEEDDSDASSVGELDPSTTGTKALGQPMNTIPINGTSKNSSSTLPESNSTSTNSTEEGGEAEDTPASDGGAGRVVAGAFSIGLALAFVGLILLI